MIKRFLAVLVAVSLFSLSVFAEEPYAPIVITNQVSFADGENVSNYYGTLFSASSSASLFDTPSSSSWRFILASSLDNQIINHIRIRFVTNGTLILFKDTVYCAFFAVGSRSGDNLGTLSLDINDGTPINIIEQTNTHIVFTLDTTIDVQYLIYDVSNFSYTYDYQNATTSNFYIKFASIQELQGYSSGRMDDVVQAIEDQTDSMQDQWNKEDQAMAGGVNPGQSGVNDSISQGITDLDDFDNQIFADFDKYKSDLDFGLSAWSEAAAGISYIGSIFMIIWDNSPNQVIVLSLMLGLCGLVLGRGARLARAARRSDRGADDG